VAQYALRYKGFADRYVLDSEDLKRHGIEGFRKTTWEANNKFTAPVPQDVAEKIAELMPDDFEVVTSDTSIPDEVDDVDDDSIR
jgi:hypothetical protein